MKTYNYGIKNVSFADSVEFPFATLTSLNDGEKVSCTADWTEMCLRKPGSLSYQFVKKKNVMVCNVTMEFDIMGDLTVDWENLYFKAEDMEGNLYLIGLGSDYDTVPVVELGDSIGSSAGDGNKEHVRVTWECMAGRILAVS